MTASRTHTLIDSPIGELTLVATDDVLSGVYMAEHHPAPDRTGFGPRADADFAEAATQFGEYFAGDRTRFTLPLAPVGTAFQLQVWEALRQIEYGTTRTYSQIALAVGRPTAIRAVAAANARNPLSIVVPCHRVIGSGGKLTGYAGGVERKRFLLEREAEVLQARDVHAPA
ncbi:methylated-DNA--[protein]-cysteine S-methyltransferase [Rhodococcus sp. Z13]|uniref:Methylated-DNA--[protein]-cysteine S-methyltransferase n=1 Tax=Rhodococcus sacchari TaxID=2962047 RepID=A0ACD4DFF4_9NOCA|nr:methylated-DNA--[protein]-cysteine S-methyltransferase [Rhodococcus sp. Z13]UYP18731.1 methylated-DNA--[protein]-cysteine S-methyltransferase [Rhodococcus sp. Z13]